VTRWAALAALVAVAGLCGFGLRAWRSSDSEVLATIDDQPILPVVSEQERFLLAAVERYATPTKLDKIRQGAGHHVELGVFYWQQKRYADAERFFDEVIRRPNAPLLYRSIGSIGLAVTYGLRDEAQRSNLTFLEVKNLSSGLRAVVPQAMLPPADFIELRYWMLTALDRNATRPPVPKELEDLRKDLRRPGPIGRGAGKAP
jgi:hypothetical protein